MFLAPIFIINSIQK